MKTYQKRIGVSIPSSEDSYPEYDWKNKLFELTGITYFKVEVSKINYENVILEAITEEGNLEKITLDYIAIIYPTLIKK